MALLVCLSVLVALVMLWPSDTTRLPASALSIPSDGQTVSFPEQFDSFEWDKVYVFGGYLPKSEIRSALGFEWKRLDRMPEEVPEGHFWVVFVRDRSVVRWMDCEWPTELSEISGTKGIPRDETVFRVTSVNGRRGLSRSAP